MRIYIIGMPASGKTTFGKKLAQSIDYQFVDMDNEIVASSGKSIPQLFEEDGEAHFRKLEQETLYRLLEDRVVISTGGGAPCFFQNMEFIKDNGLSVFLDVSPKTLMERAMGEEGNRPLLNGKSGEKLLEELKLKYQKRIAYYKQADLIVKENEVEPELVIPRLNLI